MMDAEQLLRIDPYSLPEAEKGPLLLAGVKELTRRHQRLCPEYARILSVLHPRWEQAESVADIAFLPVGVFKGRSLKSIPETEVFKTLTSSGTMSSEPSRIVLDRSAARRQSQALAQVVTHELGEKRLPMIVMDSADAASGRGDFSARTAAIRGFSSFGRSHFHAFRSDFTIDEPGLRGWLESHVGEPIFAFGFTFMVWQFSEAIAGLKLDLSRASLIHGGGWKKLQGSAVSKTTFRQALRESMGISNVRDYYGMIEQIGSIFLECQEGVFHCPAFADVSVRNPADWTPAAPGELGVIAAVSLLPSSYPGHAVLTEDLGTIAGVDDCLCGRLGRTFTISGRAPKAQARGCSDARMLPEAAWN